MTEFNNDIKLKIPEELMEERYVEPFRLSIEEAKKICEANNVVWGVV